MADYIRINEHSTKGDLAISRKVLEKITDEAVNRVFGAEVAVAKNVKIAEPTQISFKKDGTVNISVSILLKKGVNPQDVCVKIQQEVAHDLAIYTESIPFEIEISIADVK